MTYMAFLIMHALVILISVVIATNHKHYIFNMQMGYVAAAPSLSDRSLFKSYYRTYPSDASFVPALMSLIEFYKWKNLLIITENANTFITVSKHSYSMQCSHQAITTMNKLLYMYNMRIA